MMHSMNHYAPPVMHSQRRWLTARATLGDFKSRVSAVGPQAGYFFKVGNQKWYANLKGYYEFDAKNRPEGWNVWLTLAIPLGSGKN